MVVDAVWVAIFHVKFFLGHDGVPSWSPVHATNEKFGLKLLLTRLVSWGPSPIATLPWREISFVNCLVLFLTFLSFANAAKRDELMAELLLDLETLSSLDLWLEMVQWCVQQLPSKKYIN